jgi:GT2 family glycosyltransferase
MKPKISIVLPIFNKIEIVEPCILANIRNARSKLHWILIDNNSELLTKQGILRIAKHLQREKHLVKIITEPENTGVARAWNKGIRHSGADFVLLLNNDCVLQPEWDLRFLEVFADGQERVISAFIFEPGMVKGVNSANILFANLSKYQQRNKGRFRPGHFIGITLFARRETYIKVGMFDENFWLSLEETDFLVRSQGQRILTGISGDILGFHLSSVTRKSVKYDETGNRLYFAKKHGWDFADRQNTFINKLIRSWHKRLMYYRGQLSEIPEKIYPSHRWWQF